MIRLLLYLLSLFLALGNLGDLIIPYSVEIISALLVLAVFFHKNYFYKCINNFRGIFPLITILITLFFATLVYGPTGVDDTFFNYKFLLSIFLFVILSSIFNSDEELIIKNLFIFAIGTTILSLAYFFDLIDGGFVERNDRLLFLEENPNSLSTRVAMGIVVFFWSSLKKNQSIWLRIALFLPIPFLFNLILASGSKGSFILCVLAILFLLFFSKNIRKKYKIYFVVASIMLLIYFSPLIIESNLFLRLDSSNITTGRSDIWSSAINIFLNNPLGVGENGYLNEMNREYGERIDTHNVFLYLLVTGGLIPFLLFVKFMIKLLVISYKVSRDEKKPLMIIFWCSMFFVMNKTGGVLTYLILWYFLAMIFSYQQVFKQNYQ